MEFDGEKFQRRLAAMRAEKGWSQQELADASGLNVNSIARYENGSNLPGLEAICNLATALNCSLDVLTGLVPISGK